MDEATFQTLYVKTYCDSLESCCASAAVPFGRAGCEEAALEKLAEITTAQFVPEGAASCVAALTWFGMVCPTMGTIAALAPGFACNAAYNGTVPPGSACDSVHDCMEPKDGSALCLPISFPGGDVCQSILVDRGAGEKCTRLIEDTTERHACIDGYTCDEDRGICIAECQGGLGDPCGDNVCQSGLHCEDGLCVRVKLLGEACTDVLDCYSSCENGVCVLDLGDACYSP